MNITIDISKIEQQLNDWNKSKYVYQRPFWDNFNEDLYNKIKRQKANVNNTNSKN